MTGLGSSETKTAVDSELAVAHLVFKVADLKRSCQFYSNLGIPPFAIDGNVALIELRGGTHLLLLEVDQQAGEQQAGGDIAESVTGQFHERLSEQFDLMIKGKPGRGNSWVTASVSEPSRGGIGGTSGRWNRTISADPRRCDTGVDLHTRSF
jgi:hypothetical protein